MHIMVTGSTGFIGRELCLHLASQGHVVHALCRSEHHPLLPLHTNIIPFVGDILNSGSLQNAMNGCEQVYHTAALAKLWTKVASDFFRVNVVGTRNVLETAVASKVKRIVHTSTCGVWGPTLKYPVSENDPRIAGFPIAYERTKFLAELEVKAACTKGLDVVIVNPSRVYGKGPVTESNTVGKMVSAYVKGRWRINPAGGKQVSNYAYLDDVVRGHVAAMEKGIMGERYILGGEDISYNQFFHQVGEAAGRNYRLVNVSAAAIKWYSRVEWLKTTLTGLPPFLLPEFADRLRFDQRYSSQKAMRDLGYTITPFDKAIRDTVAYFQTAAHV
jgi:nucleoside-diphosphate-sugar epimerase